MRPAIKQYNQGSTTMVERIKQSEKHTYPVFIVCPEPGFKASYFNDTKHQDLKGINTVVWKIPHYRKIFLSNTSIPEAYMNMSFILGIDWNILLIDELFSK